MLSRDVTIIAMPIKSGVSTALKMKMLSARAKTATKGTAAIVVTPILMLSSTALAAKKISAVNAE